MSGVNKAERIEDEDDDEDEREGKGEVPSSIRLRPASARQAFQGPKVEPNKLEALPSVAERQLADFLRQQRLMGRGPLANPPSSALAE